MRPAHELADAVRRRKLSSRELLDHYLDRIDRLDPPLNAVVTLDLKGHAATPMRPMPRWRVVM